MSGSFFYLSDKTLGGGSVSHQRNSSRRWGRERVGEEKKNLCPPQGEADWDGILQTLSSAEERLSLWNKAFNLCLQVLCGVSSLIGKEEKTWKQRKWVKNSVCIPGNPSHAFYLVNRLNHGKSVSLQGHVCFLYLSIFHPSCLSCLWPAVLPSTEWPLV